jgi:four helix bundle protein
MQSEESNLRQRTKQFALQIVWMFSGLPKTTEAQVLGKQALRSGTSVGANYREAYRARSKPEFIAKCGDSLRDLEETVYWLELLGEANCVNCREALNSQAGMRRAPSYLCDNYKTVEGRPFLILPSSF